MPDVTLANAAKIAPTEYLRQLYFSSYQQDRWVGAIPWTPWGAGGKSKTYQQIKTLPTTNTADPTDTYVASEQTYEDIEVFLKIIYNEINLPLLIGATMNNLRSQRASLKKGQFLSFGQKFRDLGTNGKSTSAAVGATAVTKGVDGFVPGPRLRADVAQLGVNGLVKFKYDDTAKTLQVQFPGETAYGPAVDVTGPTDLTSYPMQGQNSTNWAYVTFDASDSDLGGNWETTAAVDGVTLSTTKDPDGVGTLCHPDQVYWGNLNKVTPSANGDPLSIDAMRWLIQRVSVVGPKSQMAMICNERGYRTAANLIDANATVTEFMGVALAEPTFAFDGVPFFTSPSVKTNEVVGSTTNASSMYCVLFDRERGFHVWYATAAQMAAILANASDTAGVIMPGDTSSPYNLPVYYRSLGERQSGGAPAEIMRLDSYVAPGLMQQQAMARLRGLIDG